MVSIHSVYRRLVNVNEVDFRPCRRELCFADRRCCSAWHESQALRLDSDADDTRLFPKKAILADDLSPRSERGRQQAGGPLVVGHLVVGVGRQAQHD